MSFWLSWFLCISAHYTIECVKKKSLVLGAGVRSKSHYFFLFHFMFISTSFPVAFLLVLFSAGELKTMYIVSAPSRSWSMKSGTKLECRIPKFKQQTLLSLWSWLSSIHLNSLYISHKAEGYCFILVHFLYSFLAPGDSQTKYQLHHACINLLCFIPGGAEPRQTQLGTPEWRPACPNHGRRCSKPCRDQTKASRGGSQQVAGACSK